MKLFLTVVWIVTLVAAFGLGRSLSPRETTTTATQSFSEALDSRDFLVRMYGVAKALEGLTPEDLDENLAVFEENRSALSDSEIRAFMTAWSRFDPEAAYAWSNRLQGYNRTKFAKIALWAWAAALLGLTAAL